jgi:large conductance mechanosensitive channel
VSRIAELAWNGITYGNFLAAVLNFLIIAFVIFLIVRTYNNFTKRSEKPPVQSREEILLEEIRDLLSTHSP